MMKLKWFTEKEFNNCKPSCSMSDCQEHALLMLDKLRDLVAFPIILNSAYRSPAYEKKKGRSGSSSHCKGLAFDIRCTNSYKRASLVFNASELGFTRIGISKNFIHIDCDSSKDSPCIWLY